MSISRKVIPVFVALAIVSAACSASQDDTESSQSELDQRIVSIDPSGTEIVFGLGLGDSVVAVDSLSTFPEGTPVTDLSAFTPNTEAILGFEPDVVVMSSFYPDVQAGLEAAGVEVLLSVSPTTFDDLYSQIEAYGVTLESTDAAASLIEEMQADIDEIVASVEGSQGRSYYHELDDTLYSATSSTFIGEVYGLFGLANVADAADADGAAFGFPQLNVEYLIDADPDLIFLADTVCCGQTVETVAARPGWSELQAVQSGAVVELNDDVASRWGPRVVDFVAAVADGVRGIE